MDVHNPDISVVVPLLNEQDNVGPLYEQLTQALTDSCRRGRCGGQ